MSNLISCYFMGGLGNQLFQASHALAQGLKHKRDVVFLPESFTPMQGRKTDNFVNNIFRNLKFVNSFENFDTIESQWEFSEIFPSENNTMFYGYFQSSKNFLGFENEIRDIFLPTEKFVENSLSKFPQLKENKTLSLHIRRGDCFQNLDIHPIAREKYIQKALEKIGDYSHIFIFSDDKNWVKENLHLQNSIFIDQEDYEEIWLMSLCQNNIIVNSTFSWWGSFLNKNKDKKVVAPSIWFGPRGPKNYSDIYEPYWSLVNVKYNNGWLD